MATCYNRYSRTYYTCNSTWYSWGRWVALAVILVAFILFFFLCSCLTARRRRKAGMKPLYGTGWAANNRFGGTAQPYQPSYPQQQTYNTQQAAPPYNAQSGGEAQGYYGGQQQTNWNEMQAPQNTYRGGENVYQPPSGPPPGK